MRTVTIASATLVALAALVCCGPWSVRLLGQAGAPADQAVITDLVLANRILASEEVGILKINGHVSYRSRTNPNHFFIARETAAGLVTAKDIYEATWKGSL